MVSNHAQGHRFEERFARRTGGKLVVGSGSQWFAKLDVQARKFLDSCKSTRQRCGVRGERLEVRKSGRS